MKANYPRFYRQMLDRLAKAQRVLARRVKDSARWNKQRIRVAKLHEKSPINVKLPSSQV